MKAFEYASPTTRRRRRQGPGRLADRRGALGRDRPDQPDEGLRHQPRAGRLPQGRQGPRRHRRAAAAAWRSAPAPAWPTWSPTRWSRSAIRRSARRRSRSARRRSATWRPSAATSSSGPRCWYFRNGFGLLGIKDGKSLVRAGDNRYHSIFLTDGDALFVSPSSLAVPLIALGAEATILGPKGTRTIPVEKLYQVPKSNDDRELTVAPGELLTKVTIPAAGKNGSYEVRQKQAHDWPLVMAAVNLKMDGDTVRDARVVLYGVAPIPWRSEAAEKAIRGKAVTMDTATAAGDRRRPGGQAALDERLQGHAGRDGRQACPARRRRQSLLGGGLIVWPIEPTRRRPTRAGPVPARPPLPAPAVQGDVRLHRRRLARGAVRLRQHHLLVPEDPQGHRPG